MTLINPITVAGKRLEIVGSDDSGAEILACAKWLENHAGATRGNIFRLSERWNGPDNLIERWQWVSAGMPSESEWIKTKWSK